MSTITKHEVKFSTGKKFKINVESYNSAQELVQDCKNRDFNGCYDKYDRISEENLRESWHGVNNYDEALELLRLGYQPTVDKLQVALKINKRGTQKRIAFENNVHGFAPVVPLAMKGVPKSMIDMQMKPIKCKVVDVYYDMTISCGTSTEDIIKCGQKLLSTIIEMEKQGYRFNLYAVQSYTGDKDAETLCVKVKSSDKPIDLKRISFPLTHPAFFRVIGFDWLERSPATRKYRSGRGRALNYSINTKESKELAEKVWGSNAIYISCHGILHKDEEYIKEVLTK